MPQEYYYKLATDPNQVSAVGCAPPDCFAIPEVLRSLALPDKANAGDEIAEPKVSTTVWEYDDEGRLVRMGDFFAAKYNENGDATSVKLGEERWHVVVPGVVINSWADDFGDQHTKCLYDVNSLSVEQLHSDFDSIICGVKVNLEYGMDSARALNRDLHAPQEYVESTIAYWSAIR